MTKCSALSVREFIASSIVKIGRDPSPTESICLAWILRNRAEGMREAGCELDEIGMAEAEQLCDALLADLGGAISCNGAKANGHGGTHVAAEDDYALNRALVCVSMVWDGVIGDPTNGATRVHPHDEQPEWAQDCEATALIGSMLFFRAEPAGIKS